MFKVSLEVDQKPKSVLSSCLFGQKQAFSQAVLRANNAESLEDYQSQPLKIDSEHIPKIQRWINKRKFKITEKDHVLEINVGDLFSYELER